MKSDGQTEIIEETTSLRQTAYRKFKAALFSGRIKPGDFMSQREIVDLLGVPLGPVREALKSLESEGIATLLPKRGIRIIRVERNGFEKAIEVRRLIEGFAAARYAEDGPLDMICDIEAQTRAFEGQFSLRKAEDEDFFRDRNRVDFLLHDTIISHLENPILSQAFNLATEHSRIFRLNLFANDRVFELPAIAEHLAIIAALKARDPETTKAAVDAHLDGALRRAMPVYS